MECDEGPVGMLEVVGRVPVHRRVLALDDLYPTGRDFAMGYLQSKLVDDLCVNDIVRPTRIPPRQSGAARPCSTPPGGARQGPIAGYVLQSAAPTGPSP